MQTCELTFRRARAEDDASAIAAYIHLTDPYIYPTVCTDPRDGEWVELIRRCLPVPGELFSAEHLFLAMRGGETVGICCMIPCGAPLCFLEGIAVSKDLRQRMALAMGGYFLPLLQETAGLEGYCVTNLCVDPGLRGQGVGKGLLAYCLSQVGDAAVYLDVLAENPAAIRLYESLGFEVLRSYTGFSGSDEAVPCFHMRRPPAGRA
jgi:ribosomal protein S18 acetylase RimI-like enzyme